MGKGYVFFNPIAGNGAKVKMLEGIISDKLVFYDITQVENYSEIVCSMAEDDYIIICGGDGTLNCFINTPGVADIKNDILYFPCGSGNDFAFDLGYKTGDAPFSVKEYIKNLPIVTVNGKTYRFFNAVGYGIDGYCCEEGERLRKQGKGKINYTSIAIKGLLYDYKPTGARVIVDGKIHTYKKVWLAPAMYGRYYGGGMMPAPEQRRGEDKLSITVVHDTGKLKTLMIFPSIFKGELVKYRKKVDVFEGRNITVEFDRPTALQIDGETIKNVTSYTAVRYGSADEVADETEKIETMV